ncbi:MAG: carboxypeptidase-like regulatory domain-containing protein [Candidatus Micrarchaeota archaeon]|nr:carboxypeptidase-like regulatory domain-containing protein [Candidatus Micrarchaeota archaeon]
MKFFPIFALLALFAAQAFAYDVVIKVTVSQGTLAVGTGITIIKDGTPLYSAKADGNGGASFKLDAGSYFVYLDRGGYSRHINLLEVSKSDNITYTMRQLISYASAYGQVTGPTDFSNASVAAYANGNIAKRIAPNRDGYYLMSYMPEGDYEMVFNAQGFVEKSVPATLLQSQFSEVNAKLGKVPVLPMAQPAITVPSAVQRQSVIWILLVQGSLPLSGQVVDVKTPSGSVEAITGADGKAYVNAAALGEYVFTYGNLTAKTMVEEKQGVPVQQPNATEPAAEPAAAQPQKPADTGLMAGLAMIAMAGVIVALGIALFVASKISGKSKPKTDAKAHGREEPDVRERGSAHKHAHAHQHKK